MSDLETYVRKEMNRLRGRLAGFVEACGIPEREERLIISTMKQLSYDVENHIVEEMADNGRLNK